MLFVKSRLLVRLGFSLVLVVVLFLAVAVAERRKPVLLHILAQADCACGEFHQDITGLIVFNPFRTRLPERSTQRFFDELLDGRCTVDEINRIREERPSLKLLRGLANGFQHFVAGLDVVELGLQEDGFGVELVGFGGFELRAESGTLLELLSGDSA